jgi:hypothetical protein
VYLLFPPMGSLSIRAGHVIYYDWNDVMYDARGMFCEVVGDNVFVTDTGTCLEDTEYPNQKP